MVHARSKNSQASLAAQRVIARQNDGRVFADERVDDQGRQQFPKLVNVPDGMAEETMVVGEVTEMHRVAGD